MNPLRSIHVRAIQGGLAGHAYERFLGSEAFAHRLCLEGEQGEADKVAMLLFMLKHVSLDPKELQQSMALLDRGVVNLSFFGWCNPVGLLQPSEPGDVMRIRQAVSDNVAGERFKAAKRAIKWRARQTQRQRWHDAVVNRIRGAMQWPTRRDEQGRVEQERLVRELHRRADEAQDRRRTRLAKLSWAAGPQCGGWAEFLAAMAGAVMAGAVVEPVDAHGAGMVGVAND